MFHPTTIESATVAPTYASITAQMQQEAVTRKALLEHALRTNTRLFTIEYDRDTGMGERWIVRRYGNGAGCVAEGQRAWSRTEEGAREIGREWVELGK